MAPICLTIAGSDSGGGAGIQADLKTFAAYGLYGASVVTALTAQNTRGVLGVHLPPASFVALQIDTVAGDLAIAAAKTGMLASREIVEVVAARLAVWRPPALVVDPVMVAASGDPLLDDDAVDLVRSILCPLATVVTPNRPEAEVLLGRPLSGVPEADALELVACLGGRAVLLKGGHDEGTEIVDVLAGPDGPIRSWRHRRLPGGEYHGTGCTLSSAIAAGLASGRDLVAATGDAIDYVQGALEAAPAVGSGARPLDHQWRRRER